MAWCIYLDRRRGSRSELLFELEELRKSVPGTSVEISPSEDFESSTDAGKFRDFVCVAVLDHADVEVLTWLAEELVQIFGWAVDLRPFSPDNGQE